MANIRGYVAPERALRPAAEGFAAYETEGRRVGALYNEAGEDYRRIGALMAQQITDKRWPFDILELEKSQEAAQRTGAGSGGGAPRSFRTRGGNSGQDPFAGRDFSVHDQISSGMAALGDYVGNQNYKPATGTQLNTTGGQLIDFSTGQTSIGSKTAMGTDFGAGGGMVSTGNTTDYSPGAITSEQLPGNYGSPPAQVPFSYTDPGGNTTTGTTSSFFQQLDQSGGANIAQTAEPADTTYQSVTGAASSFVQGLGDWYSSAVSGNSTGSSDSGSMTSSGF